MKQSQDYPAEWYNHDIEEYGKEVADYNKGFIEGWYASRNAEEEKKQGLR